MMEMNRFIIIIMKLLQLKWVSTTWKPNLKKNKYNYKIYRKQRAVLQKILKLRVYKTT